MSSVLRIYQNFLARYPKTCQSLQTGLLMGTGDVIAQTIPERKSLNDVDFKRTVQFIGIGCFLIGPAISTWYRVLDKYVGGSSGKTVAFQKVAYDQVCFAPICTLVVLSAISTIHGRTFEETKMALKRDYLNVMLTNYKLWPLVQIVNFYFVPLNYQILVVQSVAIFWNAYLSYTTRPYQKY